MIAATISAVVLSVWVPDEAIEQTLINASTMRLLIATGITSVTWITTTFLTKPENFETLKKFYVLTHPGGPGWKKIVDEAASKGDVIESKKWDLPQGLLSVVLGAFAIYSALFSIGNFVFGNMLLGIILLLVFSILVYLQTKRIIKGIKGFFIFET